MDECCGSGCRPCILDVAKDPPKPSHVRLESVFSQDRHVEFKVISTRRCGDVAILAFEYVAILAVGGKSRFCLGLRGGQHLILRADIDGRPVSRPYTPFVGERFQRFPGEPEGGPLPSDVCFQIAVTLRRGGVMSAHLERLKVGDVTKWRGPFGEEVLSDSRYRGIALLCQGTAIAPLYSYIAEVLADEDNETRIALAYCSHTLGTAVFRDELRERFAAYWNFSYRLFVTGYEEEQEPPKYREPVERRKMTADDFKKLIENADAVGICGSEGFVEAYSKIARERDKTILPFEA